MFSGSSPSLGFMENHSASHFQSSDVPCSSPPRSAASTAKLTGRKPRPKIPADKRKRAARACNECRRKKEKCDGRPACGRCLRYRIGCRYDVASDPRTRARTLEPPGTTSTDTCSGIRGGSTQNVLSESEKLHYLEKIVRHYLVGRTLTDNEIQELASSLPEEPRSTQAQDQIRDQEVARLDASSSEAELGTTNPVIHHSKTGTGCYDEDLSLKSITQTIRSVIGEKLPSYMPEEVERIPTSFGHGQSWDTELKLDALRAALTCFPPKSIAKFLLDVFFRYLQTSIYYVEETWAYQILESCYSQPSEITPDHVPSVCTLLMVMACGTQFAHLESFQLVEKMARQSESPPHFSEDDIGQKFHQAARTLIPYTLTASGLHSVQACLMMATYNFSLDSEGASYVYLSLALSLAVQQGMHRRNPDDASSLPAAEVRKRVWWTVYILHLQDSIRYGRPKFLVSSEIDVEKPVDQPELRPLKEVSSFTNQRALIELTLTTETIADEIAALRRTTNPVHSLNLLSIRQKMVRWWKDYPGAQQPLGLHTNSRRLRNEIHLRLYYCNTRISLGRPLLLATPPLEVSSEKPESRHRLGRESLVQDAIDGALEIIDLCQTLRDHVGLSRASYVTEFTSCRTAMLVLLAQSLARPSLKVREALSRGLEIIKIMAIGSALASSEVQVIEVLERAVIRLNGAIRERTEGSRDRRVQGQSDYDAFKTWTRLWQPSSGFTPLESYVSPVTTSQNNDGQHLQGATDHPEPPSQHELLDPHADYGMPWGSFPQELSQFDLIPSFDIGADGPSEAYEQNNETMQLNRQCLSGILSYEGSYQV